MLALGVERAKPSAARDALQAQLNEHGIPLQLLVGADVHLVPGLLQGLRDGIVPTLNGTRYVLLEPSHHVAPPRFAERVRGMQPRSRQSGLSWKPYSAMRDVKSLHRYKAGISSTIRSIRSSRSPGGN